MIAVRRSEDRGTYAHRWLESHHTFSFGRYRDPDHPGYRAIRAINEDRLDPGGGFGPSTHRDMEIITFVLAGRLHHTDDLAYDAVLGPGDVQRLSAGRGIRHSDRNPSTTEPTRILQIWILPRTPGTRPSWTMGSFPAETRHDRLCPVATDDGRDGSLPLGRDAAVHAALLDPGERVDHSLGPRRHTWVQVVRGHVELPGAVLGPGDGAAVEEERELALVARSSVEAILVDLD